MLQWEEALWSSDSSVFVQTLPQLQDMSPIKFTMHTDKYSIGFCHIWKRELFTEQFACEQRHPCQERQPVNSPLRDASSSNCRSSAPPGAKSINSYVLYKRHSKTQANTAGLGKVLISNLRGTLDESVEETINNLAVCACKNEITAHGKVFIISTFCLH